MRHHRPRGGRRSNTEAADWTVQVGRLVVAYNHPDHGDNLAACVVTLWRARYPEVMRIEGHYDRAADIAWLRFEGYDPARAVADEAEFGLVETDPDTSGVVGLEYWRASCTLPEAFLSMLASPEAGIAA